MVFVHAWQLKTDKILSNAVAQKAVLALQQQFTLNNFLEYRLLLAFGSNLGNRKQNLNSALVALQKHSTLLSVSRWQKTKPLKNNLYDTTSHEFYINFVAEVKTSLDPHHFYTDVIVKLEDSIGHSRTSKWMARALDIDVVFAAKNDADSFQDCTPLSCKEGDFFVPHLEYSNRIFWRQMIEDELNYVPKR